MVLLDVIEGCPLEPSLLYGALPGEEPQPARKTIERYREPTGEKRFARIFWRGAGSDLRCAREVECRAVEKARGWNKLTNGRIAMELPNRGLARGPG